MSTPNTNTANIIKEANTEFESYNFYFLNLGLELEMIIIEDKNQSTKPLFFGVFFLFKFKL